MNDLLIILITSLDMLILLYSYPHKGLFLLLSNLFRVRAKLLPNKNPKNYGNMKAEL